MTQFFSENGDVVPVTVIKTPGVVITQVRTKEKDGYTAVQVGFGTRKEKNLSKSVVGHTKDLGNFADIREFRLEDTGEMKRGDKIEITTFAPGDIVEVSAISKAKGFQGVVKRYGFKGGPRTHGQSHSERAPGSIGAVWPQRVIKGKRMGGRMGGDRITIKNLEVAGVDQDNGFLLIKGAVPGRRGTIVEVRSKK